MKFEMEPMKSALGTLPPKKTEIKIKLFGNQYC